MSTWHQQRAGNDRPIPNLNLWTLFVDQQNGPCYSELFSSEDQAKQKEELLLTKYGGITTQILPPQWWHIAGQVRTSGYDSEDLDDLVHEMKANEAADINNEGLDAQVKYIASQCRDAEELVRLLLRSWFGCSTT